MAVEVFVQPYRVVGQMPGMRHPFPETVPAGPPAWVVWGPGAHPASKTWYGAVVGDVVYGTVDKWAAPVDGKVIRKAAPQLGERV